MKHAAWKATPPSATGVNGTWAFCPKKHLGCGSFHCEGCDIRVCLDPKEVSLIQHDISHSQYAGGRLYCHRCHNITVKDIPTPVKRCVFCAGMPMTKPEYDLSVCGGCLNGIAAVHKEIGGFEIPTTAAGFKAWIKPGPPPFADFPNCNCNTCRAGGVQNV